MVPCSLPLYRVGEIEVLEMLEEDFEGPIYFKNGLCIIICAVYFELTTLSTTELLKYLFKFICNYKNISIVEYYFNYIAQNVSDISS